MDKNKEERIAMQYHQPSTYRRSTNQIVAANHVFVVDVNDHFVLMHYRDVQHFVPQRLRSALLPV